MNRPVAYARERLGALLLILLASPCQGEAGLRPDFFDLRNTSTPVSAAAPWENSGGAGLEELVVHSQAWSLTPEQGRRASDAVKRLGSRRPFRRLVTWLLNAGGGILDRAVNGIVVRRLWKEQGPLPNLAQLSPGLLRGGQPSKEGFRRLKSMGVAIVVNLRRECQTEKAFVTSLGMRYVSIPIPDTEPPTVAQAHRFLRLAARGTPTAKVFFHCAAGVYRTGTMAALYRIAHGWGLEAALQEARSFGFDEGFLNADREVAFLRAWATSIPGRAAAKASERRAGAPGAPLR